jgi:hypothetical protein
MAHWAYLPDNPFTILIESIQRMTPNERRHTGYKTLSVNGSTVEEKKKHLRLWLPPGPITTRII